MRERLKDRRRAGKARTRAAKRSRAARHKRMQNPWRWWPLGTYQGDWWEITDRLMTIVDGGDFQRVLSFLYRTDNVSPILYGGSPWFGLIRAAS